MNNTVISCRVFCINRVQPRTKRGKLPLPHSSVHFGCMILHSPKELSKNLGKYLQGWSNNVIWAIFPVHIEGILKWIFHLSTCNIGSIHKHEIHEGLLILYRANQSATKISHFSHFCFPHVYLNSLLKTFLTHQSLCSPMAMQRQEV